MRTLRRICRLPGTKKVTSCPDPPLQNSTASSSSSIPPREVNSEPHYHQSKKANFDFEASQLEINHDTVLAICESNIATSLLISNSSEKKYSVTV